MEAVCESSGAIVEAGKFKVHFKKIFCVTFGETEGRRLQT